MQSRRMSAENLAHMGNKKEMAQGAHENVVDDRGVSDDDAESDDREVV